MSSLKVRSVEIGKGIPKIIAPICDKTEEEILHTARKFSIIPVDFDILDIDIVEWRVDLYDYYNDYKKIEGVLEKLRKILKNIPIIFILLSFCGAFLTDDSRNIILLVITSLYLLYLILSTNKIVIKDIEVIWLYRIYRSDEG